MARSIHSVMRCALLGVLTAWALALFPVRSRNPMSFAKAANAGNGLFCSVSRADNFGHSGLAAALTDFEFVAPPGQLAELDSVVSSWARRELLEWTQSSAPVLPRGAARGIISTGWPTFAMWSSFDQQPSTGFWWFKARNGIVLGAAPSTPDYTSLSPHDRVLPTRIVPLGFAACAAFWAFAWFITLMIPARAKRHFRRRSGRCINCGYDRRGLALDAPCPECGSVLR